MINNLETLSSLEEIKIRHGMMRYVEELSDSVGIEMRLIPKGKFVMGSPPGELERLNNEEPQHLVAVNSFFMAKYPLTQAQWKIVAAFPQQQLQLQPSPSHFQGDNRPVEQVSWYDAIEFCLRLSQKTGKHYRLPTEAEWEYACRGGTNSPFHFGKTITTDIANYRGMDDEEYDLKGYYGEGTAGEYRKETTPVDKFGCSNAFGLCDMHGNVWEWCEDCWHENYKGAPNDSNAWLTERGNAPHVVRGGSWYDLPQDCRCAIREWFNPNFTNDILGFRIVCEVPEN